MINKENNRREQCTEWLMAQQDRCWKALEKRFDDASELHEAVDSKARSPDKDNTNLIRARMEPESPQKQQAFTPRYWPEPKLARLSKDDGLIPTLGPRTEGEANVNTIPEAPHQP